MNVEKPPVPKGYEQVTSGEIPENLIRQGKVLVHHIGQTIQTRFEDSDRMVGGWVVMEMVPDDDTVEEYLKRNAEFDLRIAAEEKYVDSGRV